MSDLDSTETMASGRAKFQAVAREPLTVTVDGPQIFVNGVLVAERSVGITATRDELWAELRLHRTAAYVGDLLNTLVRGLERYEDANAKKSVRDALGRGLVDGLLNRRNDHSDPLVPNLPPEHTSEYRDTYEVGHAMRAMRDHLDRERAGARQ